MKKQLSLRRIINSKTLFGVVFITMALSTVYVAVRMITAPSTADSGELGVRIKGDYTLMLLQCVFGTLALLLPSFIAHRLKIIIPSGMMIAYAIFLFCAIYLGEVRSFYYSVPHWDTILHAFSGFVLAALGFTLISYLNNTKKIPMYLSPSFVAVFTFCFAVALGVIWEIYEFSVDYFFHTNMQRFSLEDGTLLVGQVALMDTMKDLIINCVGALTFSIIGYMSLVRNTKLSERLVIKKRRLKSP